MRAIGNIFSDPNQKRLLQDIQTAVEQAGMDRDKSGMTGYFLAVDKKSSGTHGGSSSPNQWVARALTTVEHNIGEFGSLSSNRITLLPGSYDFYISVPACQVGKHQARLRSTQGGRVWLGTVEVADVDVETVSRSIISGRITTENKIILEIQHIAETDRSSFGFGLAGGFGDEIYTVAEFRRIGG